MPRGKLPDSARVLPPAGQKVWLKAFGDALDEGQSEEEASKEAWGAVKRAGYSKQSDGKWGKSMDFDFSMGDDDTFVIGAPILKINTQKRIVEGFATLNNVDLAHDLVDAEASQEAFGAWYGNIREMHEKKAVGKAIDWQPDVYKDNDGTEYNGIWVRAKISKGAEDTWQKVLDGTLSGFSIGGATLEKQRDLVKGNDGSEQQIWRITKYRLTELSLVDSPCNRLASISLIKSIDGGIEVDDTVADGEIEKAYNGETMEYVDLSHDIEGVVGALESWRDSAIRNKADDAVVRASEILGSLRSLCRWEKQDAEYQNQNVMKSDENGSTEGESMEKSEETLQDKEISDTNGVEELTEAEKSVFKKFIDFIKGTEAIEKSEEEPTIVENDKEGEIPEMNTEDVTKAIDEVKDELTKGVDEKFTAVGDSLTKIAEALEKVATAEAVETFKTELKTEIDALVERVSTLENSGAVKKSGEDADKTGEKIEKDEGFWGSTILPAEALRK